MHIYIRAAPPRPLQRLILAGVDTETMFTDSRTALHIAAADGYADLVKLLLEAKV